MTRDQHASETRDESDVITKITTYDTLHRTKSFLQHSLLCQPLLQLLLRLFIHNAKIDDAHLAPTLANDRQLLQAGDLLHLLRRVEQATQAEQQHELAIASCGGDGGALALKDLGKLVAVLVGLAIIAESFFFVLD